jgi:hypothetical protein
MMARLAEAPRWSRFVDAVEWGIPFLFIQFAVAFTTAIIVFRFTNRRDWRHWVAGLCALLQFVFLFILVDQGFWVLIATRLFGRLD